MPIGTELILPGLTGANFNLFIGIPNTPVLAANINLNPAQLSSTWFVTLVIVSVVKPSGGCISVLTSSSVAKPIGGSIDMLTGAVLTSPPVAMSHRLAGGCGIAKVY